MGRNDPPWADSSWSVDQQHTCPECGGRVYKKYIGGGFGDTMTGVEYRCEYWRRSSGDCPYTDTQDITG